MVQEWIPENGDDHLDNLIPEGLIWLCAYAHNQMHIPMEELPLPRCRKARCCREIPGEIIYKPVGIPLHNLQTVDLALDEYEVFLLCDYEGLDQTAAGQRMGVSRGTIQRLLAATRHKIAGALANGQAVRIMPEQKLGGNV